MEKELLQSLISLFERDLGRLKKEISLFDNDLPLNQKSGTINNPAGNLALHLCGNLQHYIGAVLGKSGYVRNRDHEFAATGLTREGLITEIEKTHAAVIGTLHKLDHHTLQSDYPEPVFNFPMTTLYFLIHLQGHLNYHLGQINYHRRMI